MSAHVKTSEHSRNLCDLIVERLGEKEKIPIRHAENMCSVGSGPVFLYIYHQRDGLTIYLYCDLADPEMLRRVTHDSLTFETRRNLGSDWAKITPYFVKIKTSEAAELVPHIYEFLASKPRPEARRLRQHMFILPSEEGIGQREEGGKVTIVVSRYERDPNNRRDCIKIHGTKCKVCGFDFAKTYGAIGDGFIHVHHLTPLSQTGKKRKTDPKKDLTPVCANCHEMLHRRKPPYEIEELKALISAAQRG